MFAFHWLPSNTFVHTAAAKMSSTSSDKHHQALVIAKKDATHTLVTRATPQPGPGQLLIEVKAIAMNPVDAFQRDVGALIQAFPTVLGSDIAGVVVSVGPDAPSNTPQPGCRVAAYASAYFHKSEADFGSFQKLVLVGVEKVTLLPDFISFAEGSILPMSVSVAMSAWYRFGIPRNTKYSPGERQGMLVWGASTSVGTAAVQSAKSMGFHVYATASPHNHEYLQRIGADRVFDYKSDDIVSDIVSSVKKDGISLHHCFLGQGNVDTITSLLGQIRGDSVAKIGSAPIVPTDAKKVDGVEVIFLHPPMEAEESYDYYHWVFNEWLTEKLANKEYIPSPHLKVVDKGLEAVDKALDELKQGVSGTKLVVELD
jgi:NADPH:quinone reductase-like Zn-dependent oxidoreductase